MLEIRPILLVEDDVNDAELVLRNIAGNLANKIIVSRDGREALDYLLGEGSFAERLIVEPILILLDLKLPKVDSWEVLRQIKLHKSLRSIPVIALLSSSQDNEMIGGRLGTVEASIVKPVDFKKIVSALAKLPINLAVIENPVQAMI